MPFAATLAAAVILIEKLLELVGFALRVFPPEETLGGVLVRDVVAAVWDQLYFVLRLCNTLGASAAGWMMLDLVGGRAGWIAAAFARFAGLLTLLLIFDVDCMKWPVPAPPSWLFALVFTGYRTALALVIWWTPQRWTIRTSAQSDSARAEPSTASATTRQRKRRAAPSDVRNSGGGANRGSSLSVLQDMPSTSTSIR